MARNLIELLEQVLGSNEVLSRINALKGLNPEKVSAIPGAGDAIKPVTDPMQEKLRAMTA
jgi:hypothetical protein